MTPRLWLVFLLCLPLAAIARADGLDVQLRLDDGRLGVRLVGSTPCDGGDLWGALELGRECRGEIGWDLPVRGHYSYDGRYPDYPVRLRGDWRDRGTYGDWDARYYGDPRDGARFGGRVRFVPREPSYDRWDRRDPWWRDDRRDDEWRDVYVPGTRDDYRDDRARSEGSERDDWREVRVPGSSRR